MLSQAKRPRTLHQKINSIKHLCTYALGEENTDNMVKSLEFRGMPIGFGEKMRLKPGERPDTTKARTVAVIEPHEDGMLESTFDREDQVSNPLIKYFDDFTAGEFEPKQLNSRQSR